MAALTIGVAVLFGVVTFDLIIAIAGGGGGFFAAALYEARLTVMTAPDPPRTEGELDPLIHAPVRLKVVVTLSALGEGDSLTFPRLQELLGLTPGNLVTHLRKLEQGGYVETQKTSHRKGQSTSVRLTAAGRGALEAYTRSLQALLVPIGVPAALERERDLSE